MSRSGDRRRQSRDPSDRNRHHGRDRDHDPLRGRTNVRSGDRKHRYSRSRSHSHSPDRRRSDRSRSRSRSVRRRSPSSDFSPRRRQEDREDHRRRTSDKIDGSGFSGLQRDRDEIEKSKRRTYQDTAGRRETSRVSDEYNNGSKTAEHSKGTNPARGERNVYRKVRDIETEIQKPPTHSSERVEDKEPNWGLQNPSSTQETDEEMPEVPKEKANFGLTGILSKDERTGNIVKGVVLKWSEPLDAAKPDQHWRLYVFKDDKVIETLHIHRQSSFLIGRDDRVSDIVVQHPSCSQQHAVIQFRKVRRGHAKNAWDEESTNSDEVLPYLLDLQSTHGTLLNNQKIESARYYELREKDCLRFGGSTREYVLLREDSA